MAVTRRTLQLARKVRATVDGHADSATATIVAAWARAWGATEPALRAAIDELLADHPEEWPGRQQLRRSARVQHAMVSAQLALRDAVETAVVTTAERAGQAAQDGAGQVGQLIASQMPVRQEAAKVPLASVFGQRVRARAVNAIQNQARDHVYAMARPLESGATSAMERVLVRGVASGLSPEDAAREIVNDLEGAFNGGLARAMTVARTEILDAYRAGSRAAELENADVLEGWEWVAELDENTCEACWAMDGTTHPLEEEGPDDHPNGRCTRLPIAKPWAQLGWPEVEEPDSVRQTGRDLFDSLSRDEQLAIMGPTRLAALEDGTLTWDQIAVRTQTVGWRDSYQTTRLGRPRFRHLSNY